MVWENAVYILYYEKEDNHKLCGEKGILVGEIGVLVCGYNGTIYLYTDRQPEELEDWIGEYYVSSRGIYHPEHGLVAVLLYWEELPDYPIP